MSEARASTPDYSIAGESNATHVEFKNVDYKVFSLFQPKMVLCYFKKPTIVKISLCIVGVGFTIIIMNMMADIPIDIKINDGIVIGMEGAYIPLKKQHDRVTLTHIGEKKWVIM